MPSQETTDRGEAQPRHESGRVTDKDCPFCARVRLRELVAEEGTVCAIKDAFPVTRGHTLVIPRRHVKDYFDMTDQEKKDAEVLLVCLRERILGSDPSVMGFNIGVNSGEAAGQTVMHAHIHLIPRRMGDVPDPRGGIRAVVPGRSDY